MVLHREELVGECQVAIHLKKFGAAEQVLPVTVLLKLTAQAVQLEPLSEGGFVLNRLVTE